MLTERLTHICITLRLGNIEIPEQEDIENF